MVKKILELGRMGNFHKDEHFQASKDNSKEHVKEASRQNNGIQAGCPRISNHKMSINISCAKGLR